MNDSVENRSSSDTVFFLNQELRTVKGRLTRPVLCSHVFSLSTVSRLRNNFSSPLGSYFFTLNASKQCSAYPIDLGGTLYVYRCLTYWMKRFQRLHDSTGSRIKLILFISRQDWFRFMFAITLIYSLNAALLICQQHWNQKSYMMWTEKKIGA